ncbi:MAG: hypothetical protein AAGB26_17745 [Planctomycetota bacterium]
MKKSPYIPDDNFGAIASDFLHQHNSDGTIPVPIESIVEFKLGIDIVPVAGLIDTAGINAFITRSGFITAAL